MTEHLGCLSVLLIEHNRILLEGLSRLLTGFPDIKVAGVADSASAGLALFDQKRPAVTLIDLELPGATAAILVRQIREIDAGASILILATYELDPACAEAIASGAAAVVAKSQICSMLAPLIRSVAPPTP